MDIEKVMRLGRLRERDDNPNIETMPIGQRFQLKVDHKIDLYHFSKS